MKIRCDVTFKISRPLTLSIPNTTYQTCPCIATWPDRSNFTLHQKDNPTKPNYQYLAQEHSQQDPTADQTGLSPEQSRPSCAKSK